MPPRRITPASPSANNNNGAAADSCVWRLYTEKNSGFTPPTMPIIATSIAKGTSRRSRDPTCATSVSPTRPPTPLPPLLSSRESLPASPDCLQTTFLLHHQSSYLSFRWLLTLPTVPMTAYYSVAHHYYRVA